MASTSSGAGSSSGEGGTQEPSGTFECNICLDTAHDAVVSMCGHLFCWPCLHRWMETQRARPVCPVCKAAISKDRVVPLYGRNTIGQPDPRDKVPPRPSGQRTEPEQHSQGFMGGLFGGGLGGADTGVQMSFGIGAFPFGLFANTIGLGGAGEEARGQGGPREAQVPPGEAEFMSKVFLGIAIVCLLWLLCA